MAKKATTRKTTTKKTAKPSARQKANHAKTASARAKAKKAPARAKAKKSPANKPKATAKKTDKKMSQLDAAHKVLSGSKYALGCKEMIDLMAEKGLWTSPGGKTPENTLSAAIRRDINTKGDESRFTIVERGKYGTR